MVKIFAMRFLLVALLVNGACTAMAAEPPPSAKSETELLPFQKRLFGTYRLHIGVAKPTFNDLELYEDYYDEPSFYPSIALDFFAFDWFVTFGARLSLGFYNDKGFSSLSADSYTRNPNGKIEMTMIPTQLALTFQTTAFRRKWLVASGWFGFERLYYQETRLVASGGAQSAFAGLAESESSDSTTSSKPYVNSGWKSGSVMGAALSISLDPLRDGSINTMEDVMGLKTIFITPYIEIANYDNAKDLKLGRNIVGVAFTFESVR